jgi:hypothetical protein
VLTPRPCAAGRSRRSRRRPQPGPSSCHFTSPVIDPLPRPGTFGSHAVAPTTQAPIRSRGRLSLHRVTGARLEGGAHSVMHVVVVGHDGYLRSARVNVLSRRGVSHMRAWGRWPAAVLAAAGDVGKRWPGARARDHRRGLAGRWRPGFAAACPLRTPGSAMRSATTSSSGPARSGPVRHPGPEWALLAPAVRGGQRTAGRGTAGRPCALARIRLCAR